MSLIQLPDEQLVELALSGMDAFTEIVRRYQRKAYDIAFRMVRHRADAEDITQEVFLRVYRSLKQYDPKYKFSNWILKIATNLSINHLKKTRLKTISLDEHRLKEICPAKDYEIWDTEALKEVVNQVLDTLLPKYKMAFMLVYQEDYRYQEAAEMIGVPLGSFKTCIHKARDAVINVLISRKE
jgi:RNA polymerase sigma-70 factor (ECF subfamily)